MLDSKTMETKKKPSLKTNKKPKKSSKAKQIDNAKRSPEEKRRQLLQEIIEKTGLGENEIIEAEEKFKDDFPDGRISLEEFIDQSDVSIQTQLTKQCGLHSGGRPKQNLPNFLLFRASFFASCAVLMNLWLDDPF